MVGGGRRQPKRGHNTRHRSTFSPKRRGCSVAILWGRRRSKDQKYGSLSGVHGRRSAASPIFPAHPPKPSRRGDRVTFYLPMIRKPSMRMIACARIAAANPIGFVFGGGASSPDSLGRPHRGLPNRKGGDHRRTGRGLRGGRQRCTPRPTREGCGRISPRSAAIVAIFSCDRGAPHGRLRSTGFSVWRVDGMVPRGPEVVDLRCPRAAPMAPRSRSVHPVHVAGSDPASPRACGAIPPGGIWFYDRTDASNYCVDYFPRREILLVHPPMSAGWNRATSYTFTARWRTGHTTCTDVRGGAFRNYSPCSRFWEVHDKHRVNIFYTAPRTRDRRP